MEIAPTKNFKRKFFPPPQIEVENPTFKGRRESPSPDLRKFRRRMGKTLNLIENYKLAQEEFKIQTGREKKPARAHGKQNGNGHKPG